MSPKPRTIDASHKRALAASAVLAGCLIVSLFALAYPLYVIRPFRLQGAGELAAALTILRLRPPVMALSAILGLAAFVFYWRAQPGVWRQIIACFGVAGICLFATLSRINIYELMFHPMRRPEFEQASATKLNGAEKVIAVRLGATARAYPIRIISYHHIVNDALNNVPIVATY